MAVRLIIDGNSVYEIEDEIEDEKKKITERETDIKKRELKSIVQKERTAILERANRALQ